MTASRDNCRHAARPAILTLLAGLLASPAAAEPPAPAVCTIGFHPHRGRPALIGLGYVAVIMLPVVRAMQS